MRTRRPYLSVAALGLIAVSVPAARLAGAVFGPEDDFTGYGGLSIALWSLWVFLATGLGLAGAALIIGEKPKVLSLLAAIANGGAIALLLWLQFG